MRNLPAFLILCLGLVLHAAPAAASCPYLAQAKAAGLDDGCPGADKGRTPYPWLLNAYGAFRPQWDVAGVDFFVGVSRRALLDPSTAALPNGCAFRGKTLTCKGNNVTVSGYDFGLHGGMQIYVPPGANSITITENRFKIGADCLDPAIDARGGGTVVISHNTFVGDGGACAAKLVFGTMIFGLIPDKATVSLSYNLFSEIPVDVIELGGPAVGAATFTERYDVKYLQGYTGHPDGVQFNGGNFGPIDVSFNTYYNIVQPTGVAGTQPFHIEAQLSAALANTTVDNNTIITPGSCHHGSAYPTGCAVNYDVACKNDSGSSPPDSNTAFSADGNYIDASGAVGWWISSCGAQAVVGASHPNVNLQTGASLSQ